MHFTSIVIIKKCFNFNKDFSFFNKKKTKSLIKVKTKHETEQHHGHSFVKRINFFKIYIIANLYKENRISPCFFILRTNFFLSWRELSALLSLSLSLPSLNSIPSSCSYSFSKESLFCLKQFLMS